MLVNQRAPSKMQHATGTHNPSMPPTPGDDPSKAAASKQFVPHICTHKCYRAHKLGAASGPSNTRDDTTAYRVDAAYLPTHNNATGQAPPEHEQPIPSWNTGAKSSTPQARTHGAGTDAQAGH